MENKLEYFRGFSLLEILIALCIMAGILLGIITWQNFSLRQIQSAYFQNIAMMQAEALIERFRANHSTAGIAQEFAFVQQQIVNFLPQGSCSYQCNLSDHNCLVSMCWQDHGAKSLSLSTLI